MYIKHYLLLASILLTACASQPTHNTTNTTQKPAVVKNSMGVPSHHLVSHGDTVSKIASQYQLNWRDVAKLNHLDSNNTIYVGQWLVLWRSNNVKTEPVAIPKPAPAPKIQQTPTPTTPTVATTPTAPTVPTTSTAVPPVAQVASTTPPTLSASDFVYPVVRTAQMVRAYGVMRHINGTDIKSDGVWFAGKDGDLVVASRAGTVIYADDNSVLDASIGIRHTDGFISEYRFIKDATVKAGQNIKTGERIASMKPSQNGVVVMEFRLSKNNAYVDPMSVIK